jgi:cytochrome c oxidase subunit IV
MAAAEGAETRKAIIRTAFILAGLTAFEFLIAFTWESLAEMLGVAIETGRTMKNLLFIILTLFKAFYIVAEFMHMKYEVKRLMWTIILPFIFIIWLIIGLIMEGSHWGKQTTDKGGFNQSNVTYYSAQPLGLKTDAS